MSSEVTQDEKCRVIAEWLGWKRILNERDAWVDVHNVSHPGWVGSKDGTRTLIPDFYRDETANALIKNRIRSTISYMVLHREDGMEVVRFVPKVGTILTSRGTTEFEAIADAGYALALREKEEK